MRLGIIGLPNSGKTTIFNALTRSNRPTGAVSSGKIEIFTAVVPVPDPRLEALVGMYKPKRTVHTTITYTDIGGLEKGIGAGGLNGALRNELQQVDGFLHVVRAFEDDNVPHPEESVNPARDLSTIDTEFILADMLIVEKRLEKMAEDVKRNRVTNKMAAEQETEVMTRFKAQLDQELPLRDIEVSEDELKIVRGYGLLSIKPVVVIFNVGEKMRPPSNFISSYDHRNTALVSLQGKVEAEISQLEGDDAQMFLAEYGIIEPSARRVIWASYELMKIQTFFTVGEDECRAWSVTIGANAPQAAGVIHSDLARGFIRAEVMAYADLMRLGSEAELRKVGLFRLEGKEYIVKDGDIMNIRFAV